MPVSLVSLKRTDKEKIASVDSSPKPELVPDFSWGLTINLGHEELQKLGFARDGIEVGKFVAIAATAIVTNNSIELNSEQTRRNITLQFSSMQMVPMNEEAPRNAAELIYGGRVAKGG